MRKSFPKERGRRDVCVRMEVVGAAIGLFSRKKIKIKIFVSRKRGEKKGGKGRGGSVNEVVSCNWDGSHWGSPKLGPHNSCTGSNIFIIYVFQKVKILCVSSVISSNLAGKRKKNIFFLENFLCEMDSLARSDRMSQAERIGDICDFCLTTFWSSADPSAYMWITFHLESQDV